MTMVNAARASTVCRRLDLNTPVTVRPRSHAPSSFYSRRRDTDIIVPESPVRSNEDVVWQPGQTLPIEQPIIEESPGEIGYDVQSMLQSMQYTIETQFDEVKSKLSELEGRVIAMESKQRDQQSSPASSSAETTPGNGRKKRVVLDLQVIISILYYDSLL